MKSCFESVGWERVPSFGCTIVPKEFDGSVSGKLGEIVFRELGGIVFRERWVSNAFRAHFIPRQVDFFI